MPQEATLAAAEAQLTIEQQRADTLQASLDSQQPHDQPASPAAVVSIQQARAAAAEATRMAQALQDEVSSPWQLNH